MITTDSFWDNPKVREELIESARECIEDVRTETFYNRALCTGEEHDEMSQNVNFSSCIRRIAHKFYPVEYENGEFINSNINWNEITWRAFALAEELVFPPDVVEKIREFYRPIAEKSFIGTAEAAEILAARFGSYARVTVKTLARTGKIPGAHKNGRDWMIPREWAETHEKTRM